MIKLKEKLAIYGVLMMLVMGGFLPFVVHAALPDVPDYNTSGGSVTDSDDIIRIVDKISAFVFWFLMALSILMVIYAAFLYVTAAGDSEKVGKANQTITYAVIGIAVALIASGVPTLVLNIIK